jgi:2-keto-4-pentenoate hydratase/2-oxohepta-3-ene-1,7-dioic acid hydratase in catechol pathway
MGTLSPFTPATPVFTWRNLMNHRHLLTLSAVAGLCLSAWSACAEQKQPLKFARFLGANGKAVYGLVEGDHLREITGRPFSSWQKTERLVPLSGVKFLAVTEARTVYALAGNYRDHLAGLPADRLEKFKIPQFFLKAPGSLCGHGHDILYPKNAGRLDYEGELVVVIGKRGRGIPREKALEYVFGVTAGNDVSARDWQQNDVQWWRAKGADTFGPCGPYIVTGLDYGNLDLQVRVNGEIKMKTNTRLLVHDIPTAVAFLSQYVALQPGDLIFTGTAGQTQPIKVGDVVEVELEGVGALRNKVASCPQEGKD